MARMVYVAINSYVYIVHGHAISVIYSRGGSIDLVKGGGIIEWVLQNCDDQAMFSFYPVPSSYIFGVYLSIYVLSINS